MVTPSINSQINTSSDYLDLQIKAKEIAKILALDLNSNEEHRKEVFTRIANKFDGDYNILVSHLSDETIKEIEQKIKTTAYKKQGINILSSENYIKQIVREEPKLQLMMPFAKNWSDEKIEQLGGLVVAYYPFGVDDKKVKEIIGYDRNGNEIKITKQSAPTIPYIILTINERTDEEGYLKNKIRGEKQKSIYGIDPKEIAMDNKTTDWKRTSINSLRNKNLNPTINKVPEEGGGGGNPPPTTPGYLMLTLGSFAQTNDDAWGGGYWLEGDPEFYVEVTAHNGLQITFISDSYFQYKTVYKTDSPALPYGQLVNLKVMEKDGGLLGPDDEIDRNWRYGSNSGTYYGFNPGIPVSVIETWWYGDSQNCHLTLYWHTF